MRKLLLTTENNRFVFTFQRRKHISVRCVKTRDQNSHRSQRIVDEKRPESDIQEKKLPMTSGLVRLQPVSGFVYIFYLRKSEPLSEGHP